ncbi:hypothetical protein SUGI_1183310 [Cryptomeria japonica]|uniref:small RNA-binding protein 11, chloroplastic n=1 Tax=Cryptomeria japonica TaxID=3369 RepID=UPI002414A410|nr:small RNA-binding protein 11, chloroplastic [Cryptomeria japonica]GLJ55138.1 hypothetical protein SUGI_1183310 [Cryptomeria japonica]
MAMVAGIGRFLKSSAAWRVLVAKDDALYSHYPSHTRGITTKLFVGGLSFYTTEDALRKKFSEFGEVVDVKIIMDRGSQRSKGFGFIWYASEADAEKAKSEMCGKVLHGRIIYVDASKPKWAKSQLGGDLPGITAPFFDREETAVGGEDFGKY